jgi:hypothetical protein
MPRIELTEVERMKLAKAGADSIPCTHGWQPIETAPNDGTPFIGIQTFKSIKLVAMAIVKRNPKLPEKIWQCCTSVTIYNSQPNGEGNYTALPFLTHWMPLPKPPRDQSK